MPRLSLGLGVQTIRKVGGVAPLIPQSGLSLWLKADAGVTLSGANVTAWADQSGNGFNASGNVAGGGVNPAFESNVKNGKPALLFGTGNTATILRTAPTTFGNSGEFTIFTAHQYNNINNTWAELISKGDLASSEGTEFSIAARHISSSAPTQSSFGVMGVVEGEEGLEYNWNYLFADPASTNWSLICATQSIENDSQKYHINGSLVSSSESVVEVNPTNISIGIGNGGDDSTPRAPSNGGFSGYISEIIFYNREVTTPERQQVEAYLNTKYAIYL